MAYQLNAILMEINLVVAVVVIAVPCANVIHLTLMNHVLTTDKFINVSFFISSRMMFPSGSRGTEKQMIEVSVKGSD